jgi:sugar phosphate isomerase/epimerase
MKRFLLVATMFFLTETYALAADRWFHVKVEEAGADGETVRINMPLSLAEKVLPVIHTHNLHEGKVKIGKGDVHDVDLRAIMDALRTTPDNEFITIEGKHENIRVAKAGGNLLIKVRDSKAKAETKATAEAKAKAAAKTAAETVDVTVPFPVVEALLSAGEGELDVLAAVRALAAVGDTVLVAVDDGHDKVRIWVDSQNTME